MNSLTKIYIRHLIEDQGPDFIHGFKLGILAFAHWKGEEQFVGIDGVKLKDAFDYIQVEKGMKSGREHTSI